MIERVARGLVCALLERIESGQLTLVENGVRRVFGSGSPQATVVVRDPRVWPALARGGKQWTVAGVAQLRAHARPLAACADVNDLWRGRLQVELDLIAATDAQLK